MTILSQYAQDRLVLVVDHATEFKEMFTQFVDVELRNGVSLI
jgi:DNA repair exonuclease SbcCD ATPase subunit